MRKIILIYEEPSWLIHNNQDEDHQEPNHLPSFGELLGALLLFLLLLHFFSS